MRFAAALLVSVLLFCMALEVFARVIVERRSAVQRQVNAEYAAAVALRSGAKKQLLIVGNSLVGHGVDFAEVERDLPAGWEAHRFWIYNTAYEDWHYGLQRLFAAGSRPTVIAVVFAAMHWASSGFRGDYSAQYLLRARDIRTLSADLHLDRTNEADLLLAHYSKFYALRSEIRKQALQAAVPSLPDMYGLFEPVASLRTSDTELIPLMARRMAEYRDIAATHGAKLVLVVPPLPRPRPEYHEQLIQAAALAGVQLFVPMSCSDLPAADFIDDMHMNGDGSQRFTSKLMAEMGPALAATP